MFKIFSFQTVAVSIMAIISTYLSIRYELHANFPLTLIGTAIIFPIVFTINSAFKRRETVLSHYGSLKALGRSIYFASRDWGQDNASTEHTENLKNELEILFANLRELFLTPVAKMSEKEEKVYASFSAISKLIVQLKNNGLASGEVSRCNQYLSKMILAFENIKHIYQYRTPRNLRAYSVLFLHALPVVYGPYFAHLAQETHSSLHYVMPLLFSIIFVGLDNIQEHLENPFDMVGCDDVVINVEKFISRLEKVDSNQKLSRVA